MTRYPAVAGQFYPADAERLRGDLRNMIPDVQEKKKVVGLIAPHAGYMYSGSVAGSAYAGVVIPRTVIILGPNHSGLGAPAALYPDGEWVSPLGNVPIEPTLSRLLREHAPVTEDSLAHRYEHSLEVHLPFLQFLRPDLSIVPLCLGFSDFSICSALGRGISGAVTRYGEDVLIVASSDMTHYESAEAARRKDGLAIAAILALDPQGLLSVCRDRGITMCGVVPATVMLVAARGLGGTKASLIRYGTSGDVSGDNRRVVAYAAIEVA